MFRFAPSPNGELHLGHALSALTGFEWARRIGGRFLVRIEDIDVARARPEFVTGIFEDLRWLGMSWDEPVLVQSRHFDIYRTAAATLEASGLLYPCFATRTEIAERVERKSDQHDPDGAPVSTPASRTAICDPDGAPVSPPASRTANCDPDGAPVSTPASRTAICDPDGAPLYPGLYRGRPAEEINARIARGEPFALRIDMAKALAVAKNKLKGAPLTLTSLQPDGRTAVHPADPARWGDAVIVRKDVPASYHLAVVVDDARQGITHVTRGQDLLAATDLHRLLQVLLGLPEPVYHHHPLIADDAGRKLSKSARDTSLASLRNSGVTADAVRARLGFAPASR